MDTGCYLSIDFEDFAHDLQRRLGIARPQTRPDALRSAVSKIRGIIHAANGSKEITYFSTGQVARDHGDILHDLVKDGNEVGCHCFYHDNISELGSKAFGAQLDQAIEAIRAATNEDVLGFRAPSFSIQADDSWAYEEIAARFLYDSSLVSTQRKSPDSSTEVFHFDSGSSLVEFPIFRHQIFPGMKVRVMGGTYLKVLPLKIIFRLMEKATESGFLPLIYLHPYEFLNHGEFWSKPGDLGEIKPSSKLYWQIRQNQWLSVGNLSLMKKLEAILKVYPPMGTMRSHIS